MASLVAVLAAFVIVNSLRMFIVVGPFSGRPIPLVQWIRTFVYGQFLNMFVLQLGNVYRAVTLKSRWGLSHTHYAGTWLFFAWLDTILNCLIAIAALLVSGSDLRLWNVPAWLVVIAFLAIWVGLPVIAVRWLRRHEPRVGILQKIRTRLLVVADAYSRLLVSARVWIAFVLSGIVSFSLMVAAFHLSFLAVDTNVSPVDLAVLQVFSKLSFLLIITPGNLGIREVMMAVVCQGMGISVALAMLASLIMRLAHCIAMACECILFAGADACAAMSSRGKRDYSD